MSQQACNEQGLVIIANVIDTRINPDRAAAEVIVQLTVFDAETGESHNVTAPGYAEDWSHKENKATGDKAVYKAVTGATKYAVRSFFCLPSEDDPERSSKPATNENNKPATNGTNKPVTNGTNKPVTNSKPNISRSTGALIDQTSVELKRLNWSNDRGKLYLQEKFGKASRRELSEPELQQFLTDLRSQPTAAPMPVPAN